MIKYLLNKTDKAQPIYRVNFKTMRYELIASKHGYHAGRISGSFREGGFRHELHDQFEEVASPLN